MRFGYSSNLEKKYFMNVTSQHKRGGKSLRIVKFSRNIITIIIKHTHEKRRQNIPLKLFLLLPDVGKRNSFSLEKIDSFPKVCREL